MRRTTAVALLCLALVAAACNSTTRLARPKSRLSSGAGATAGAAGSSASNEPGSGGVADSGSAVGGTSTGSATATQGGRATAGSATGGPAASGGRSASAANIPMGVGVTATEIKIGVEAAKDINAATAAVGAKTDNPEEADTTKAVVDYLNAHGGMAGRKINLVTHVVDKTTGTWNSQNQATCSAFTEDAKVFAVMSSSVGGNDSLAACLAQHNTPLAEVNYWPYDAVSYRQLGAYLYQPSRMTPDRWTPAYVDGLVETGFFDKGAKIGLVKMDAPVFERMATGIKSRLAAHGLSLTDEAAVTTPTSVADIGTVGGQLNNVILSFRSKNVDHVIFAEYNGIIPFVMTSEAEGQSYRPRYGLSSSDLPNTVASQAPAAQLARAIAVGWMPANDVVNTEDKRGGNYALCNKIAHDEGVQGGAGGQRLYMGYACDGLFFLKAALDRATALTPAGLRAAAEGLGATFDSPFTYSTQLGPGRHDGASSVRFSTYDAGCTCFKYLNATVRPVG